jgi:serine/threonine protein kinase
MKCTVCGNQNKTSARFCAYCGTPLVEDGDELQTNQLVDGGTYRIIRPLGKGGMGAVYLAANTKAFDRQCVIKEVIEYYDPIDPEARDKAMRRFEVEARTLASLKHPGIPDIYAYFSEQSRNYLVMEYIQGPNLAEGLTRERDGVTTKGQPLPVDKVVRYAIQMCDVLSYLEHHQPPVIHNDIKPANIILDENSGRAVLVDFGTAKTRYARQAAGLPGRHESSVYGTVGYAAPELYEGRADPRSDVYALAVTIYHLLTDDDPRSHPFQFPQMQAIPEVVREALQSALQNKVTMRPTASEFSGMLQNALAALYPEMTSGALPRPLTFPGKENATTRQQLVTLAIKHWSYATQILYDGSIAHWLRDVLHDSFAARAAEQAVAKHDGDPDAGLEHLIRKLDPDALPEPKLDVITSRLLYDRPSAQNASQSIEIANRGGGYLFATAASSEPWVLVPRQVRCAPGEKTRVPVAIETTELKPGQVYRAKVSLEASGLDQALIPIEVRIPAPSVQITPSIITLALPVRKELFTSRASFDLHNQGSSRADCQVSGNPPWLFLDPQRFSCAADEIQTVEMVGRIDLLPTREQSVTTTLQVEIEGAPSQQVKVRVQTKEARNRPSRLASVALLGCGALILLGAIVWFAITVLPMLTP